MGNGHAPAPSTRSVRQQDRAGQTPEAHPMKDLGKVEVLKALAAAEFAAAFALPLDVMITIDFGRMAINDPQEAQGELQRFLKAASTWLAERRLPVAWIACIERAQAGNLHAHIAIHVPGMRRDGNDLRGIRY